MQNETVKTIIKTLITDSDFNDFTHVMSDLIIDEFDHSPAENFFSQDLTDTSTGRKFNLTVQQLGGATSSEAFNNLKEENKKIKDLLLKVKNDLLMRAETDSDGFKVVDLSSSIWEKVKELSDEQE